MNSNVSLVGGRDVVETSQLGELASRGGMLSDSHRDYGKNFLSTFR